MMARAKYYVKPKEKEEEEKRMMSEPAFEDSKVDVVRIGPQEYIHVHDRNKNTTTLVVGPQNFVRAKNQHIVLQPTQMTKLPPLHYCVVSNPVKR